MKTRPPLPTILRFLFLLLPLHGQTAGGLENFEKEANGTSWGIFNYATGMTSSALWALPESDDPEVYAVFTEDDAVSLFADSNSSSGFFTGNYTTAKIDALSSDIFIENRTVLNVAEFYFFSNGIEYVSENLTITNDGWSTVSYSLSKDAWFTPNPTENGFDLVILTPAILETITEVGINFFPNSIDAVGKIVAIDNFALLPDLTPPPLKISPVTGEVGISFQRVTGVSYDLQMSTTLKPGSWLELAPGSLDIRGEGNYEEVITAPPKAFFRITTFPLLIETP